LYGYFLFTDLGSNESICQVPDNLGISQSQWQRDPVWRTRENFNSFHHTYIVCYVLLGKLSNDKMIAQIPTPLPKAEFSSKAKL
jgi:hypothetical protein